MCGPGLFEVLEMLCNIWEGLLIHSFLCLMMEYCGGENSCGEYISNDPSIINHLWPLNKLNILSLNEDIPLNVGFVKRCRMYTIQYAIIRIITTLIIIILKLIGYNNNKIIKLLFILILNISVYLALYYLGLFYISIKNHPGLINANSISKFLSLKLCFALTFYQNYIIEWLININDNIIKIKFKSFIIIIELIIFTISQRIAYNIKEFNNNNLINSTIIIDYNLNQHNNLLFIFNFNDFYNIININNRNIIINNLKKSLDMSDLYEDTYYNISDKYKQHTLFTNIHDDDDNNNNNIELQIKQNNDNFAEFDKVQSTIYQNDINHELAKLQFI